MLMKEIEATYILDCAMEIRVYKINDKFDLANSKDILLELSICLPDYIEWCLLNTSMAVAELNELESFQVTSKRQIILHNVIGVPNY